MSDASQNHDRTALDPVKRRKFLKTGASALGVAAVGAASTGSGAAQTATPTPTPTPGDGGGGDDWTDKPWSIATHLDPRKSPGGEIVESALSWAFGDDDSEAKEAATETVLESQQISAHMMFKERHRANERFHTNEKEILDLLKSTTFDEATAKAVEMMDQGAKKSEVENAALSKIDTMLVNSQKDLLDGFQAAARSAVGTAHNIMETVRQNTADGETAISNFFSVGVFKDGPAEYHDYYDLSLSSLDVPLLDGSTHTIETPHLDYQSGTVTGVHAFPPGVGEKFDTDSGKNGYQQKMVFTVANPSWGSDLDNLPSEAVENGLPVEHSSHEFVLRADDWTAVWDYLSQIRDELQTEVSTWVSQTYDSWQSGETTVSDLWTPARMRSNLADSESASMAVADLIGLGIPTDVNRLYSVQTSWPDEPITWSLRGVVALASAPSNALESGQTYSTDDSGIGTAFLAHRPAEAVGTLDASAYDASLNGGVFKSNAPPIENLVYSVKTNKGETATFSTGDLSKIENEKTWTVDLSGQLEDPIATVEKVQTYFQDGYDTWTQISLPSSFTIEKIENSAGEEIQKAEFSDVKPPERNDSWTSAEEYRQWSKQQQQFYQDLVDRMEDLEDDGGGGIGGFLDGNPLGGIKNKVSQLVGALILFMLGLFGLSAATS